MNGLETAEQRKAYIAALITEGEQYARKIAILDGQIDEVVDDADKFRLERRRDAFKKNAKAVEEQLRSLKGEAPHKRGATRKQAAETR